MTAHALDDALAARQRVEEDLDDGWTGAIIFEPLTALAGGILGGALVTAIAWRLAWREAERRHALALSRRVRRNLAGRP
jgi:hypothetical protein